MERQIIGILIIAVIYNIFRRRGRSRPKSAALSIGIYYGGPVVISFIFGFMFGVEESLPVIAPGLDKLVARPTIVAPQTLNTTQLLTPELDGESNVSSADPECQHITCFYDPESSLTDSGQIKQNDESFFGEYEGTRPAEPRSIESYYETEIIGDNTAHAGCDPAYPDERTCILPAPPLQPGVRDHARAAFHRTAT